MKRRFAAALCLAANLIGMTVQAESLVIHNFTNETIGIPTSRTIKYFVERNVRLVRSIISTTNGVSDVLPTSRVKTEWGRTGLVALNNGPLTNTSLIAGGYTKQYDAVVFIGATIINVFANQFRADSVTRMLRQAGPGNAVPMLQLRDNTEGISTGGFKYGRVADSVGVVADDNGPGKAIWQNGRSDAFLTNAYVSGGVGVYETGDLRRILYGGTAAYEYRASADASVPTSNTVVACIRCDSTNTSQAADTLIMWERQYSKNISNASTIVFSSAFGAGTATDTLISSTYSDWTPPTEGDLSLILAGLARLDSLTNHKVLGDKVIRIAPVFHGGLARDQRHAWKGNGGIFPPDTSAFYGFLDSLAAHPEIRVTFGVNPDSALSYERDIIKLKSVGQARFTPEVWNGAFDTTTAGGQNALYRPVDVYGRYRSRIAVGDYSGLGADSSLATLAKSALRITDSLFTGRLSKVALAPYDDWSPFNLRVPKTGFSVIPVDSILYALQQAGYSGVISDAQDPDAGPKTNGPSAVNPRGYLQRQQTFNSSIVRDFKVLTHTGYNIMGGRAQTITPGDSSLPYVSGNLGLFYLEISRIWSGALLDYDNSYDSFPYDDASGGGRPYDNILQRKVDRVEGTYRSTKPPRMVVRGNIARFNCADLSGVPNGPPAGNAWHILKSMQTAMNTINRLAGRTIIMFDYPENIEP